MAKLTEQQFRQLLTNILVFDYLPEIKKEIARFMIDNDKKINIMLTVSDAIGGLPVNMELGQLKVAAPTNKLIDSIVDLYAQIQE